jgi:DNA-binding beta-propeller fold protein YncE
MKSKLLTYASLLIILAFIGFMIYDSARPEKITITQAENVSQIEDSWHVTDEMPVREGALKAVAVSPEGLVFLAGGTFVSCYDKDLNQAVWTFSPEAPVTALAYNNGILYAATIDQVLVISHDGKLKGEWGPYDQGCIITSVAANESRVAFADAGNKKVYVLDKGGEVVRIAGQDDPRFILPSAYFDVALNEDNSFFVANTGHRRVELRNPEGMMESSFGEAGLAPEAFCGCCNPSHFVKIPGGFVTAEKGLNRIKILDENGVFVEMVSSKNRFTAAVPLDIAATEDGKIIYGANPDDSKLYVFKRKI